MTRTLFVLIALLMLATIVGRAVRDLPARADEGMAHVRFIDEVRATERAVGAIRLMDTSGTDLVYTNRVDGIWRCLTAYGALVDLQRMERLFDKLLTSPAFVRERAPADPSVYGLGLDDTIVISMHAVGGEGQRWEDEAPVLELEIGLPIPHEEQVFVRRVGERTVYVLEADPWPDLLPPARGIPPLVDSRLMPAAWPGGSVPPRRVVISRGEGRRLMLERDEENAWSVVRSDGSREAAFSMPILTYTSLVLRSPVISLPDPAGAAAFGFDAPQGRIIIEVDDLLPVELRFGALQPWGVPVFNSFVRGVMTIDPELAEILLPEDPSPFVIDGHPNPWFRLLERQPMPEPPWRWGAVRAR